MATANCKGVGELGNVLLEKYASYNSISMKEGENLVGDNYQSLSE